MCVMLDVILSKRRSGQLGNPANYAMRRIASFARRVPLQGGESFQSLENMLAAIERVAPSVRVCVWRVCPLGRRASHCDRRLAVRTVAAHVTPRDEHSARATRAARSCRCCCVPASSTTCPGSRTSCRTSRGLWWSCGTPRHPCVARTQHAPVPCAPRYTAALAGPANTATHMCSLYPCVRPRAAATAPQPAGHVHGVGVDHVL